MLLVGEQLAVCDRLELAVVGWKPHRDDTLHELFDAPSVLDELGYRDHADPVALAELGEIGNPGHRAVRVHDLADHSGRASALPGARDRPRPPSAPPLQDAAGASAQREDVTPLDQVVRRGGRIDCDLDRVRAMAAETPVAMPSRASIGSCRQFRGAIRAGREERSCSSSTRSSVRHRQMTPRPCVAMKLIASGVACSAAIVKSPSFSRSSSSTTHDERPLRTSSIASSTVANRDSVSGAVRSVAMRGS